MTAFLIIIAIALLGITAWQIAKIFKLSQSGKEEDKSQKANNKDNKQQGLYMLIFMVAFYIFMAYSFIEYGPLYLPEAASEHGVKYDYLMFVSIGVIMFVQLITQFLLFWYSYKFRGTKNKKALFYADNDKLEFVWTIIPVIVLAGLIIYGLFTWTDIMDVSQDEDTMVVEIYAYQFGWKARYAGKDNTLGKANVRYIEGANTLGLDVNDPYGQDDKITSKLHLPKDKKVLFKIRSQDVLHSAYFPFFRAQMNAVPGMITKFSFTPTVTTEEMRKTDYMQDKVKNINEIRKEKSKDLVKEGKQPLDDYNFDYYLLCNKICGISHYNMQMEVVVEEQDDFQEWIEEQGTFGETMQNQ